MGENKIWNATVRSNVSVAVGTKARACVSVAAGAFPGALESSWATADKCIVVGTSTSAGEDENADGSLSAGMNVSVGTA